jgi:hypothetical protein
MAPVYMISQDAGDWTLHVQVGDALYKQLGVPHPSREGAFEAMDYDAWLMNRDLFPGKTFSEARRKYRRARMEGLGSHVEKDDMRGVRAQVAVAGGAALVAGALVRPVRTDGD